MDLRNYLYKGLYIIIIASALSSCHALIKKPLPTPENSFKRVRIFYPSFDDDIHFEGLSEAIHNNLIYLRRLPSDTIFKYGKLRISVSEVIETQQAFLHLIQANPTRQILKSEITRHFYVIKARGNTKGKVLFTGYYEPVFPASRSPDNIYKYPIYRTPDDLLVIDLSLFRDEFKGRRIVGRIKGKKVVPYFSRRDIELEKALMGKGLEIAWLKDPLDVAFLHIQGSGILRLKNGDFLRVGFASSNGRPYRSIGRYLLEKGFIKRENMSMQAIRAFLSSHPQLMDEVLNYNPSYVFFRIIDNGPLGSLGVPLTPGRSIATDRNIFPPGALCYIETKRPEIDDSGNIRLWRKFGRFVLNQDTGGAIKGPGRVDIFWGSGTYAETAAGHMRHYGTIYLIIKKR